MKAASSVSDFDFTDDCSLGTSKKPKVQSSIRQKKEIMAEKPKQQPSRNIR
jgi:hypothetical protein